MTAYLRQEYGGAVALTARPCVFCGCDSLELEEVEIRTWAVCCPSCHSIGPHDAGQDELTALQRWNKAPARTESDFLSQALNEGDGVYRP